MVLFISDPSFGRKYGQIYQVGCHVRLGYEFHRTRSNRCELDRRESICIVGGAFLVMTTIPD